MQADKEPAAAAAPAAGKPPGICDRLQRAFHARPAFRPLRRLTERHQHSGPPLPTAPQAAQTVPVRLPADASRAAAGSAPTGPPVPAPPPDVVAGMATAADAKAGDMDMGQQTKGKSRVGSRVRKAISISSK